MINVPLLRDELSVPAQQRVGRDDRVQFEARLTSNGLGFSRQQRPLGVSEPNPPPTQPLFEPPVLSLQEVDGNQLVAIDPASQNHQHERERGWH